MPFFTRPHFEDRQIIQSNDESIQLSGLTKIGPTLLDFTGTTTAQTTVTIMGVTGYLNGGREYGFMVQPPILKISGSTGYTTTDVTGYVLTSVDSGGTVGWASVSSLSADTNTFVTGGTLNSSNQLILNWNTGGSASAIDLSALSDTTYWTAGTSGTGSIRVTNGGGTDATGNFAVAQGESTTASGDVSHSEGSGTIASGDFSHAEGQLTTASGIGSHAEGNGTIASGPNSHSEGQTTIASARDSHAEGRQTLASGQGSHAEGALTVASGVYSHAEGYQSIASGDYSHAGGDNSVASGTNSFIHSTDSKISANRSVLLGGQNLTGTTTDTVYVPNLTVRNNHILHSDSTLEVVDIPSTFENQIKGSYTEFNWDRITTNILSNNNPSGSTLFLLGNFSNYPTVKNHGFLAYYGTGYTRTSGTPTTGTDFYRSRLVLKTAEDSDGMIFANSSPSVNWWWENNGFSRMKLTSDGSLGLALNTDGSEKPTANLQIGGTGTTGSFRYIDGNQQDSYVLTSDNNGNASWSSGFTQIKEVFFKPTFGPGNRFLKGNYYPYYTDGGTDPVYIQGSIPFDMNTIISSEVLTIPEFTATESTSLNISYAGVGQVFSATTLSSTPSISYTTNQIKSIDTLNIFSGTSANDVFGFNIYQNNAKLFVIGLKIKYSTQ